MVELVEVEFISAPLLSESYMLFLTFGWSGGRTIPDLAFCWANHYSLAAFSSMSSSVLESGY